MPPVYIDGRVPVSVTSLDASVGVTTPYFQAASGDKTLAVPAPATNDTLCLLTTTQTLANKTIINPIFQGGFVQAMATADSGITKILDLNSANIFLVQLTAACTLTITNMATGNIYNVIIQQNIADSYTEMSWMTGFINNYVDSGVSQSTGAVDFWTITYDGTTNYGIGARSVK